MELSRVEHILKYFLGEEATLPQPLSRVEELLIALGRLIEEGKITNPISIKGRVNTVNDLPSNAEPGWLYFVGLADATEFTEYIYLDSGRWECLGSSMISIDTALSTTSTNPVQNSTITTELNKKPGEITTGKQYTIDGRTVTAGTGAEAFNDLASNKASGQFSHAEGVAATASGPFSHAEGSGTTASGNGSHAEGGGTTASGNGSHAEGSGTTASGNGSHAEGSGTTASGPFSHAEGQGVTASGNWSHAEGSGTTASGDGSHAEGVGTKASSAYQHVQGKYNVEDANNTYAFIIGNGSSDSFRNNAFSVSWNGSVVEGVRTTASGAQSHAEGGGTTASGAQSHAEGGGTTASGAQSHAEGVAATASGPFSHAEGQGVTASGDGSHAEGVGTKASSAYQHVQGKYNVEDVNNTYAFIIGNVSSDSYRNNAFSVSWNGSVVEGVRAIASGAQSHAEGNFTTASGAQSHAEGGGTTASGARSHAEGGGTTASGDNSHAEGDRTTASGNYSHAEGTGTTASGANSHAEGNGTKASSANQHVQGKYNVGDSNNTYAFIVGNGTADNARHNAFAIDWNGLIYVNGASTGVDVSALPTSNDFPSMTQAEYDALTPAQKTALYYFIHEDDETEEESGS